MQERKPQQRPDYDAQDPIWWPDFGDMQNQAIACPGPECREGSVSFNLAMVEIITWDVEGLNLNEYFYIVVLQLLGKVSNFG